MTGVLSSFRQTKWWAGDVASAPARGPRKVSSMDVTQATTPAVLYAAKSTQDRHASIPTQLDEARAMADEKGWTVVDAFSDEGFSAYSGNRGPGLEQAKASAARAAAEFGTTAMLVTQAHDR